MKFWHLSKPSKNPSRWSGQTNILEDYQVIFTDFRHLLKSSKNHPPMVWGFCFWEVPQVFFADLWASQKAWKSTPNDPPWRPRPPGPCPDDRAQHSVQDSLNESSVRPNPTLFFSKVLFQNTANPVPVPPVRFERPVPPVQVLNRPVKRFKVRLSRFLNENRRHWD